MRWVAADAGLDVDDAAIDAAIAQGGGSARDTLSALELIASAGGDAGDALSFDEFVEALIEHDPGLALTAMAHAVNAGHEPRPLAEALVRHLRNGFLSLMAPELVQLSSHQVDALAAQAQRLGPAALVRAIERLGEILVELRHAPDPAGARRGRPRPADAARRRRPATTSARSAARVAELEQAARRRRRRRAGRARSTRRPAAPRSAGGPGAAADATGAAPRRRRPTHRRRRRPRRAGRRRRRPSTAATAGRAPTSGAEWDERASRRCAGIVRPLYTPRRRRRRRRRHGHAGRAQRRPPRQVREHRARRRAGVGGGHRARRHASSWSAEDDRRRRLPSAAADRPPDDEDIDLDDLVDAPPGTGADDARPAGRGVPGRRARSSGGD